MLYEQGICCNRSCNKIMLSMKFVHHSKFWKKIIGGVIGCTVALCILSIFVEESDYGKWRNNSEPELERFRVRRLTTTRRPTRRSNHTTMCQNSIVRKRSFPNDRNCLNYTTRLCEETTFPVTALVSYPGSGNTWMRHLIEIATGVFTGSVYFDHTLYARGFLGEKEDWSSGSTVVQKLHVKYHPAQNFKRGILLIRDPVAATRAFVDFMESGHTGWASPTTFNRKEWPMFLLRSTHDWMSLAKSWIESPVDLLVIHYEDLINSTFKEVQRVVHFLTLDDSRMNSECFMKSIEGSFHRKPPVWKIKSPTPIKVRRIINDAIDFVNQLLTQHAKKQIPLHKYSCYRNDSEQCLGENKID